MVIARVPEFECHHSILSSLMILGKDLAFLYHSQLLLSTTDIKIR